MGQTASLAVMGVQSIQQMRSQGQQADAEGIALRTNAGLAELQAQDAIARGAQASAQVRRDTRATIGAQRVAYASQGVDVGSGSALAVQADTAAIGELDALTIKNNAAREAFGYKIDAANSRTREEYTRQAGRNAQTSTLLTGASNLYERYQGNGSRRKR
jgi:hypothetical protein